MALPASQFLLARWLRKAKQMRQTGFTLLELLIAIIIGGFITSLLLFVVIELVKANRREEVLTQTQQDMRRAMDYITRDLSEAVFVYADPAAVTAQLDDLPPSVTGQEVKPVLAFWRLDPVDVGVLPSDCTANATTENECSTLKVRQSAYTLVVYLLQQNTDTEIWEGPSRIIRYSLPKYSDVTKLQKRSGYVDPTIPPSSFTTWVADPAATTAGVVQVLTDYVDETALKTAESETTEACPDPDPTNPIYQRTPSDANSFYVCIRYEDTDNDGNRDEVTNENKNVFVYLRGNPEKSSELSFLRGPISAASRLPNLESSVLIRGAIEKGGEQ